MGKNSKKLSIAIGQLITLLLVLSSVILYLTFLKYQQNNLNRQDRLEIDKGIPDKPLFRNGNNKLGDIHVTRVQDSMNITSTIASPSQLKHKSVKETGISYNHSYQYLKVDILQEFFSRPFHSRNLVLGMGHNIEAKNYAIFIKSLRHVSPLSEVVIFMSLPLHDNRIRNISDKYRIHLLLFNVDDFQLKYMSNYHASTLRWILYYELLQHSTIYFDRVLMVDIRDTAFQSDPFSLIDIVTKASDNILYTLAEETVSSIGECGWNSGWIQDCFGESVYQKLRSNTISCSGVSIGSYSMALRYTKLLSDIFHGDQSIINSSMFPQCERNGVDQGVHNVILGLNLLPEMKLLKEKDIRITNLQHSFLLSSSLQYEKRIGVIIDDNVKDVEYLIDANKQIISIVHQYDRDKELQRRYSKLFIDWINIDDPLEEFILDQDCNGIYDYKLDVDMFKAKCDLSSYRAISLASCCTVCNQRKGCTAFTFTSDGICFFKKCTRSELNAVKETSHFPMQDAVSAYLKM